MKSLLTFFCLVFLALPLHAETPWGAAEDLRSDAGRIERLLYRAPSAKRDAEIAERLKAMQAVLSETGDAFGPEVGTALSDFSFKVTAGDAPGAAHARQALWSAMIQASRERTFAAIAAGDAQAASNWLTVRDYARASGDTAAVLAVQAMGRGELPPDAARTTVEAELLTVAASELRLALGRAAEDAAAGRQVQYAGDLGRIEGLVAFLGDNLAQSIGSEGMVALDADLTRAASAPDALDAVTQRLQGYAPVKLSAEEVLRRARLLRRFTALVWEEYQSGVRRGEIIQPMEYNEARMFRDRAAMILGDLTPQMGNVAQAARLAELLAQTKARIDAKDDGVEPLVDEALALIDTAFGAEVAQGGYDAAVDALPAALDELVLMVHSGDWAGAEMKRLEAYSWFDPDIEQRLVPRAPAMALRLEARFWEGTASQPGLGTLITRHADKATVSAEVESIKTDLLAARDKIEAPLSATGAALQSAGIIFREGLEAVLILAALLAALRAEGHDTARFRPALVIGVSAALVASFALWAAARWIFSFSTLAREALEGATALLAAAVLVWMVLGLSAGGGHVASFRAKLAGVASPWSVGLLACLVVFREGFEMVLFYEALLVDAPSGAVLIGFMGGAGAALAAGWLLLVSGRRLPLQLFFRVTTVLLGILAVMLVGAGIRGLQTAALISATPVSWFPDRDWLQLWFGLFPVAEPLAAQAAVLALMLGATLMRRRQARRRVAVG